MFRARFSLILGFLICAAGVARADYVTATISMGNDPRAAAVNPITNRVYVPNYGSNNVTVVDGVTNLVIATVAAGTNPVAVAVNPITNKIYVANQNSATVTVVDGPTNGTQTVGVGNGPRAIAVNAVTNKIYVANMIGTVTVIDGATNATQTVTAGTNPWALAVNSVTNKIYVANGGSANVTVIDGATHATQTVTAGTSPRAIAVNPVTNKIYVANYGSGTVTVVDGATHATQTVTAGTNPLAVAVNPVSNRIVVANSAAAGTVTIIDGATNSAWPVTVGNWPYAVTVNPVTNRAYVACHTEGVSVVDLSSSTVWRIAFVGIDNVVVNPVTNKVYAVQSVPLGTLTVLHGASTYVANVNTGSGPRRAAVNSVANKVYVTNYSSASMTVIDGNTYATQPVSVGSSPLGLAANPITNKIYVANYGSGTVSIVDGATYIPVHVNVGNSPRAVAVNLATDRVYVANEASNTVTVIDGAAGTVLAHVPTGSGPYAVAVNPGTGRVYVANSGGNVTVIDGATNSVIATVTVGSSPNAVAVNPVTNHIYVTNYGSNSVSVIDGATNSVIATPPTGANPLALAVNTVTNKVYVANQGSASATVIDGTTHATQTVTVGDTPQSVAVDQVANRVYVGNWVGNSVTVIDGATNTTQSVTVGTSPAAVAVNPVTGRAFVANYGSNNVKVVYEPAPNDTRVSAEFAGLPGDTTGMAKPTLTGKGVNRSSPSRTRMLTVLNRVNTAQQDWDTTNVTHISPSGDSMQWTYAWGDDSLVMGENFVCAVPLESDAAGTNNCGPGTPFAGNRAIYPLYRMPERSNVGCTRILAPVGTIDSGTVVTPACSVYNCGTFPETYTVRMKIGDDYDRTAAVSNHNPGELAYVTFPTWTADYPTEQAVTCSTELDGDDDNANDRRSLSVRVQYIDVGPSAILVPDTTQVSGRIFYPRVEFTNYGNTDLLVQAALSIPKVSYNDQKLWPIAAGTKAELAFSSVILDTGWYSAIAYTMNVDANRHNDTVIKSFRVKYPWDTLMDLPPGPSSKRIKDGACLSLGSGPFDEPWLYAFKGNNTTEFWHYIVSSGTWVDDETIPAYGISGKKKRVKKGSSLVQVDGKIYAAKGNNTLEYWRFDPAGAAGSRWRQLDDVPEGLKRVKDGAGAAVARSGGIPYVYLLKGGNTREFCRYNVRDSAWEKLPEAPPGGSGKGYKAGSGIVYYPDDFKGSGGAGTLYLLKGNYNEFFAYDVANDSWSSQPGLPLESRQGKNKKAKAGAALCYLDGTIYAMKGGNTNEFWAFRPDSGWKEKETLCFGSGKRVKGGGALVAANGRIYAFKGNNTSDFCQYLPETSHVFLAGKQPGRSIPVLAGGQPEAYNYSLAVFPNPFSNTTSIRYSLARPGPMSLTLYDAAGRLTSTLAAGLGQAGKATTRLDAGNLARGVYFLRLKADGCLISRKLLIE